MKQSQIKFTAESFLTPTGTTYSFYPPSLLPAAFSSPPPLFLPSFGAYICKTPFAFSTRCFLQVARPLTIPGSGPTLSLLQVSLPVWHLQPSRSSLSFGILDGT